MAKIFEFRNNNLEIEIAGNTFEIDIADTELMSKITGFSKEATELSNRLLEQSKDENADYGKALEEAIQFVVGAIDMMLGEDASKKIFKGRKVSFFDALDVVNFIVDEYNTKRKDNFNKYSPNRAQRRAKKQ